MQANAYDEWLAEYCAFAPTRLCGVARRGAPAPEDVRVRALRAAAGGFTHVTSIRILKPTADRAYFYLVYGTRHPKGLLEFRRVEKKAVDEQERARLTAKQESRIERTD